MDRACVIDAFQSAHGAALPAVLAERVRKNLNERGTLDVLRRGVEMLGLREPLMLAQFAPALAINPATQANYAANRLRVVRQVTHSPNKPKAALDLVLFLNGIAVATAELKSNFTQSVHDAVDQYRFDRPPQPKGGMLEPLLGFPGGALVHFAVSQSEVMMSTRLAGPATTFLPFNRGNAGAAGNAPNADGFATAYLWEEVWARESWLNILHRYLIGKRDDKKQLIFDFERTTVVVASITNEHGSKSAQLLQALKDGKKIIVCTIETFPFALQAVQELAATEGKRFAVIADEAHNDAKTANAAKDVLDALLLFKNEMGAYVRLYAFLSQIFDYGNTGIEKRFLFYKRLIPLLAFGRERDTVDLSKVVLTHHTLKNQGRQPLILDQDGSYKLPPMDAVGSGAVQEKQQAYLAEIIHKVNGLFEGELSDDDQLVYVNGVLKDKLLENAMLVQQAASNSKEQFANSPDLNAALLHAIMDALDAHTTMSTQALGSARVREGLMDVLLGPLQLYEALRAKTHGASTAVI